jgi:hypothetical protein
MSAKHQLQKGTRNEEKKSESDIDDHRVRTDKIEPAEANSKATAAIISKEELGMEYKTIWNGNGP